MLVRRLVGTHDGVNVPQRLRFIHVGLWRQGPRLNPKVEPVPKQAVPLGGAIRILELVRNRLHRWHQVSYMCGKGQFEIADLLNWDHGCLSFFPTGAIWDLVAYRRT